MVSGGNTFLLGPAGVSAGAALPLALPNLTQGTTPPVLLQSAAIHAPQFQPGDQRSAFATMTAQPSKNFHASIPAHPTPSPASETALVVYEHDPMPRVDLFGLGPWHGAHGFPIWSTPPAVSVQLSSNATPPSAPPASSADGAPPSAPPGSSGERPRTTEDDAIARIVQGIWSGKITAPEISLVIPTAETPGGWLAKAWNRLTRASKPLIVKAGDVNPKTVALCKAMVEEAARTRGVEEKDVVVILNGVGNNVREVLPWLYTRAKIIATELGTSDFGHAMTQYFGLPIWQEVIKQFPQLSIMDARDRHAHEITGDIVVWIHPFPSTLAGPWIEDAVGDRGFLMIQADEVVGLTAISRFEAPWHYSKEPSTYTYNALLVADIDPEGAPFSSQFLEDHGFAKDNTFFIGRRK